MFEAPPDDAIVVLGCRVEPSGDLSPTLRRRADWGAVAFQAGLGRWVIASGGRRWGEHVEAEQVGAHLRARGVAEAAILAELYSLTTAENAVFTAKLLERIGARRALVVTCAWHMPRAIACFTRAGVDALPLPVHAPPATFGVRAWRRAHEALSYRLDTWMLGRIARAQTRAGTHPWAA